MPTLLLPAFPPVIEDWAPGEILKEPPLPMWARWNLVYSRKDIGEPLTEWPSPVESLKQTRVIAELILLKDPAEIPVDANPAIAGQGVWTPALDRISWVLLWHGERRGLAFAGMARGEESPGLRWFHLVMEPITPREIHRVTATIYRNGTLQGAVDGKEVPRGKALSGPQITIGEPLVINPGGEFYIKSLDIYG